MIDNLIEWSGVGVCAVLTLIQTSEILQIIQAIITGISGLVVLAFTIWRWYKKASADGKITEEEIDEIIDEISDKK